MKFYILFFILLIGLCQAEISDSIPDLDDFDVIKERCDQKGGEGAYSKLKTAEQETQTCLKGIIDVEKIKTEVEEAKKTGSMDEVFGKYCGKRPQIRECIKKTHDAIQPCLEDSEKQALNVTGNILTQISDFACYRDGDRIAMFVAEGGVECLNSRVESIRNCVNQTLKFNPATFSPNSIPNLKVDKKKCDDLTTIQNCIVKDLEDHCSNTTPANVVDALFRFVKKSACKDVKRKRSISVKRVVRSITATPTKILDRFQGKLKRTCEKNGENGDSEKLKAAYNESMNCLRSHCRVLTVPLTTQQSCVANCTYNARNALKKCLKKEEQYYPDFVLEIVQSLYGVMYRNTDLILANKQPNLELVHCVRDINEEETQKKLLKCLNETSTEGSDNNIIIVPPKPQLCEKLKEADKCMSNIIKNVCIKDIQISNLVEQLFASIEAPCQHSDI